MFCQYIICSDIITNLGAYLMKIYCEFNTDYEPLLQDIVNYAIENYAIENYGNHLNIST